MTKSQRKELIAILKNEKGNIYDFIADNYYCLRVDELKDLALELADLAYRYARHLKGDKGVEKVHTDLLENIEEYRSDLIEED